MMPLDLLFPTPLQRTYCAYVRSQKAGNNTPYPFFSPHLVPLNLKVLRILAVVGCRDLQWVNGICSSLALED